MDIEKIIENHISQDLLLDLQSDIENTIKNHLSKQPYGIFCSNCGEELTTTFSKIDYNNDLYIEIDVCECKGA